MSANTPVSPDVTVAHTVWTAQYDAPLRVRIPPFESRCNIIVGRSEFTDISLTAHDSRDFYAVLDWPIENDIPANQGAPELASLKFRSVLPNFWIIGEE